MGDPTAQSGLGQPSDGEAGAGNTINLNFQYFDGLPRIEGTLGEAMSEQHAAYLKSDGKLYKALASGTPTNRVIGFTENAAIADADEYFQRVGVVTRNGWNFTHIGEPVYLSSSVGGQVTQTPTDTELGIAWTSDSLLLRNMA